MKLRISTASILLVSFALIFAGCQGGTMAGPAAMSSGMNHFPAGNYKIFFAFKPGQITQSTLFKNLTAGMDQAKYQEAMVKFEQNLGLKPEEISQVIGVMGMPNMMMMGSQPEMLVYCDTAVDLDHLKTFFKEETGVGEFEEAGEEGKKYWRTLEEDTGEEPAYGMTTAKPVFAFASTENAFVAGSEDSVKGSLDAIAGAGARLADDAEFKAAYALLDPGASINFMAWGFADQLKPFLAMSEQMAPTEEDKAAMRAFGNLVAGAMSLNFDADAAFLLKLKFADGGAAEATEKFLRTNIDKMREEIASGAGGQAMMLEMYGFSKDEFLKMYDTLRISRAGDVVEMSQRIPGDSAIFKMISQQMMRMQATEENYEDYNDDEY